MEVRFWGTRGALPASVTAGEIREKISTALKIALEEGLGAESDIEGFIDKELPFWVKGAYGTNTPCVEIRDGNEFLLCDAGSGLRDFGNHYMRTRDMASPMDFHILISHLHWDHIQGFPFFTPAYIAGSHITIYGCHEEIRKAFSVQQVPPFFPVDFKDLGAEIRFVALTPGKSYEIAGFGVTAMQQDHPGKSYGYRLEKHGKRVVYSTDSEHKSGIDMESGPFPDFINKADLLIFDAQYTLADAWTVKEDWGHSNNVIGVELARKAGVKHLCLFHQEPTSTDKELDKILQNTKKLVTLIEDGKPLRVSIALDGMVIEV